MKTELNMEDLEKVAGGNAYINSNTMKITFDSFDEVYALKGCTADDAEKLCNSFIGKFKTMKEFDQACIDALKEKHWI